LLRPGEHTQAHRHTGNVVYQVAKGSGFSIVGGRRFDWEEKDIFVVPSWTLHEHANESAPEDAVLFSFNDFPTMKSLWVYRPEAVRPKDLSPVPSSALARDPSLRSGLQARCYTRAGGERWPSDNPSA